MRRSGRSVVQIREAYMAWCEVSRHEKGAVLARYARRLGIGDRQLRRLFVKHGLTGQNGNGRGAREGARRYPQWEEWTGIVATVKLSPDPREGPLTTALAIKTALADGMLPGEAGSVPRRTWDRWLNELGIIVKEPKVRRIRASNPNRAWYVDASRSEHFSVIRPLPGGDYLLRFRARADKVYKNKPENERRLRVWVFSAVDDASSFGLARYFVHTGETALQTLEFLNWCISRRPEEREGLVMYGRPDALVLDNGPAKHSLKGCDAFARCGIELTGREPGNKRAGGRVERTFRTIWESFEASFWPQFRRRKNAGQGELRITLGEINTAMTNYLIEHSQSAHPSPAWRGHTRETAWLKILTTGGVVELEPGAIFTGYQQYEKTVGADGTINHKGDVWTVVGAYDCKGHLFESTAGELYFRDLNGYGYMVEPFSEAEFGTYRGQKKGQRDELVATLQGEQQSIYMRERQAAGKVVAMPPRVKERVEPKKPFAAPGCYPSFEAALVDFISRIGGANWRVLTQEMSSGEMDELRKIIGDLKIETVESLAERMLSGLASAAGGEGGA